MQSNLFSLDEAINKIKSNFQKISNEDIFLKDALGRCLAKPIISEVDNPKYDVSSMDGYAINYKDFANLKRNSIKKFKIVGESSAGVPYLKKINSLETVRIFTGAKLPKGSNTVIIQENVKVSNNGNNIIVEVPPIKSQFVRKKGLDFKKNNILFKEGTILKSRHLGSIAMTGQAWLTVSRKPIISILSTGNEILKVGEQIPNDKIPNGNSLMLASMIQEFGGMARILPVAKDNIQDIFEILNNALDSDLIITTGGVSVGKYDLIHKALSKFDNKIEFWKIAIRPGKPLLFSKINNTPLIGLPGNPVSSGVCSLIFVNIAIRKMLGDIRSFPLLENGVLNGKMSRNDKRLDFVRANSCYKNGVLNVTPFNIQDSSMITNFSRADCLIVRDPFEKPICNGEIVKVLKFPNNIWNLCFGSIYCRTNSEQGKKC